MATYTGKIIKPRNEKGYVALPFNDVDFRDFVKSLLGSPQTISKAVHGTFDVTIDELTNVNDLLEQRIVQQNKAQLIQFTARIVFSDDSSVLLNNIEDLIAYNEIRPIYSTEVHLNWDYLVKFEDKKQPEKQKITLSLLTEQSNSVYDNDSPSILRYSHRLNYGYIYYSIQHTARTWGADIAALLTNYIDGIIKPENNIKKFIRANISKLSLSLFSILFASTLLSSLWSIHEHQTQQGKYVHTFLLSHQAINQSVINSKIDFLANYLVSGDWGLFIFKTLLFIIFSLVVSIFLVFWSESKIERRETSFLVLTKESKKHRKKLIEESKNTWVYFCISVLLNILYGIVSNVLFLFIQK